MKVRRSRTAQNLRMKRTQSATDLYCEYSEPLYDRLQMLTTPVGSCVIQSGTNVTQK